MIEVLARTPLNYWKRRGLAPQATPVLSHVGPKAMLVNGLSSSGGDAFPYYFRKLGLGPLIGTRTWGGLIGISGNPSLADGGAILAATFRFMATDGSWAVENEGVAPDVEVIDDPAALEGLAARLRAAPLVAFDTETSSLETHDAELIGLSLALSPTEVWYLPFGHRAPAADLLHGDAPPPAPRNLPPITDPATIASAMGQWIVKYSVKRLA
jgi:hypothetical protein